MSGARKFTATNNSRPGDKSKKAGAQAPAFSFYPAVKLERVDDVDDFLTVARPLDVADGAPAAIENTGFSNLFMGHRVGGADIFVAHNAMRATRYRRR